jgi:protein phosphatase 1 regulatory subunit 37
VSYNPKITIRGWQSMVSMIKKSQALKTLAVRGFPISISMAANLGQALMVSFIHTLKLEHCGLAGRPIANLCKINVLLHHPKPQIVSSNICF